MPKATFFNLPDEKREQVFRAAVDEFADHAFEQASINRIVARAGIAKGSFYQYFENKKDLYLYVLTRIGEEKMTYLAPVMARSGEMDLFELLRELYVGGIRFAADHPQYAEIGRKLMTGKGTPIFEEVVRQSVEASMAFFGDLLQQGVERGDLRPDLDIPLFAYLITELNILVQEYYFERVADDYDERMMETVDRFIDFLRFGIGSRAEPG